MTPKLKWELVIHNNLAQLINVLSIIHRTPNQDKMKYFKELETCYAMLPELKRAIIAVQNLKEKL